MSITKIVLTLRVSQHIWFGGVLPETSVIVHGTGSHSRSASQNTRVDAKE